MRKIAIWLTSIAGFLLVAIVVLRLLFPLPSLADRTQTSALEASSDTPLGQAILPAAARNPGQSGILPLAEGEEAFAMRVALVRSAKRTIDAQYYIWHDDFSGRMLLHALLEAADSGVRVRLLLDDNNTGGMDPVLAAINAHPHIEVRLFNPFVNRRARVLGYLFDFFRLNRRMHNKSLTADGIATIVGGRNVGDEYFAASTAMQFVDMDVLAAGKAADSVSRQFDEYWASNSAYPAERILAGPENGALERFRAQVRRDTDSPRAMAYHRAVGSSPLVSQLKSDKLKLEWVKAQLVVDSAAKGLAPIRNEQLLLPNLVKIIGRPALQLDLISPYFIPGTSGTAYFSELAREGVNVRVLTNSLEATDVAPVHAGYVKYRRPLLEAGVRLFEMKSGYAPHTKATRFQGIGSSTASLHAKVVTIDRRSIFVGSFNLDPRSALLNCEMGLVFDSPAMAEAASAALDERLADMAYRPYLAEDGQLVWAEMVKADEIIRTTEPETSLSARMAIWAMSFLPIEWIL